MMINKKHSFFSGILAVLIGLLAGGRLISLLSKPIDAPVSFNLFENYSAFFFGFAFSLGWIGWVVAIGVLVLFLLLCFGIGVWLHRLISKNISEGRLSKTSMLWLFVFTFVIALFLGTKLERFIHEDTCHDLGGMISDVDGYRICKFEETELDSQLKTHPTDKPEECSKTGGQWYGNTCWLSTQMFESEITSDNIDSVVAQTMEYLRKYHITIDGERFTPLFMHYEQDSGAGKELYFTAFRREAELFSLRFAFDTTSVGPGTREVT